MIDSHSQLVQGAGSLNAHGIGTALASLGPTVAYIWNHPKKASLMTDEYVSNGLMTHLWAGVFPTVPVKNNDHAIGGDCAPNCSYDASYAAYGHLFNAIRGRSWVLAAHAAVVTSENALANLFSLPTTPPRFALVVVFAPTTGSVTLSVKGLGGSQRRRSRDGGGTSANSCVAAINATVSPANQAAVTAVLTTSTADTAEVKIAFNGANISRSAAVLILQTC